MIKIDKFVLRLDKAKKAIDEADYILIGAGAGLSTAAGIEYTGERFEKYFHDFIEEYGFTDMYSSGFYPFKTQEEKWAYWARHVYANRYDVGKTSVYQKLLELVEGKEYFVLTTNVESQFWINGFEDSRIFATQGDYGLLQCKTPCHHKLYSNREQVLEWVEKTENFRIPTELVPKCPVCGGEMELNLRVDNTFVEDGKWHQMNHNYSKLQLYLYIILSLQKKIYHKSLILFNFIQSSFTFNNFFAIFIFFTFIRVFIHFFIILTQILHIFFIKSKKSLDILISHFEI